MFGIKFLQTLVPLNLEINIALEAENFDTNDSDNIDESKVENEEEADITNQAVKVSGYISKAGVGVGRSDNDRQFIFCNGRPVDLPKITRTMNEVRDKPQDCDRSPR